MCDCGNKKPEGNFCLDLSQSYDFLHGSWYSKSPTYDLSGCKLSKIPRVRSHVQSHKLVHESGLCCHECTSSTSGCAFMYFLYWTVQNTVVQHLYSLPVHLMLAPVRQSLCCTTVLSKVLYCKT